MGLFDSLYVGTFLKQIKNFKVSYGDIVESYYVRGDIFGHDISVHVLVAGPIHYATAIDHTDNKVFNYILPHINRLFLSFTQLAKSIIQEGGLLYGFIMRLALDKIRNNPKLRQYGESGEHYRRISYGIEQAASRRLAYLFTSKYGPYMQNILAERAKQDNSIIKALSLYSAPQDVSKKHIALILMTNPAYRTLPLQTRALVDFAIAQLLNVNIFDTKYHEKLFIQHSFISLMQTRCIKLIDKYGSSEDVNRYFDQMLYCLTDKRPIPDMYSRYEFLIYIGTSRYDIGIKYTPVANLLNEHIHELFMRGYIRHKSIVRAMKEATKTAHYKIIPHKRAIHSFMLNLLNEYREVIDRFWVSPDNQTNAIKIIIKMLRTTNLAKIVYFVRQLMILKDADSQIVNKNKYSLQDLKMMPIIEELNVFDEYEFLDSADKLYTYGKRFKHCLWTHTHNYKTPRWYFRYKNAVAEVILSNDKFYVVQCYGPKDTINKNAKELRKTLEKHLKRTKVTPELVKHIDSLTALQTEQYSHIHHDIYRDNYQHTDVPSVSQHLEDSQYQELKDTFVFESFIKDQGLIV